MEESRDIEDMVTSTAFNTAAFRRILELPALPDEALLREYFRLRSWELHPDVSLIPRAEVRFNELRETYEAALDCLRSGEEGALDQEAWNDPGILRHMYASSASGRIRSGIVRRIACLESWRSLGFLQDVIHRRDMPGTWAAIHALARMDARSAVPFLEKDYHAWPLGIRCGILRYIFRVDPGMNTRLAELAASDRDPWIRNAATARQNRGDRK